MLAACLENEVATWQTPVVCVPMGVKALEGFQSVAATTVTGLSAAPKYADERCFETA